MGVGQFIYATHFSSIGFLGTGFIGPLPLVLLTLFKIAIALRNKVTKGVFIDRKNSNIVDEEGKFKWLNLIPIFGNWYGNVA
mmetsp:Transcript_11641/g.19671  ORF Transcript_11641/g.19671 Transcript_11641/m.19671 type:complete len:82 (+) Transcript_11641:302-547(+)